MAVAVAAPVIMATAQAHPLEQVVGVVLAREQQRTARHVDQAMVVVQGVLQRVWDVPAHYGVREMDVGEKDKGHTGQAPKPDEWFLVLEPVGKHRATSHGCNKPQRDSVSCFVDPLREPGGRKACQRQKGKKHGEDRTIDCAEDARKVRNSVQPLHPRLRGFSIGSSHQA